MRRGCRRIGRGAEVSSSEGCGSQNFGLGVFQRVPVRPVRQQYIYSTSISLEMTLPLRTGLLLWFTVLEESS